MTIVILPNSNAKSVQAIYLTGVLEHKCCTCIALYYFDYVEHSKKRLGYKEGSDLGSMHQKK